MIASGDLTAEWDALAERTGAAPWLRPGWFDAWTGAFGSGPVTTLTARRDGRLVGILPVLRRGRSLRSPTNWHTPEYGPVAEDDEAVAELAAALADLGSARLDLAFLDERGALARHLSAEAAATRHRTLRRVVQRSPRVLLEGDFESFEGSLPAKKRREMRRRQRRLSELGDVEIRFTDGREQLAALLDEGFAVEGSGWKTDAGTSIAQDPAAGRFYRALADWAAERGWLQLGFVRLDGRAIAFQYALVSQGVASILKVGFDSAWAKYAVGSLLTREAISRAYAQGQGEYDFLGGQDPYKLEWTSDARDRIRIQAFARTPLGTGSYLAWRHGRPVARRAVEALRSARERAHGG